MPGILYVRFVQPGRNRVRQDLVDTAAGHHIPAEEKPDFRKVGGLFCLRREHCHGQENKKPAKPHGT